MLLWRRTTGQRRNLHKKPAIPFFRRYLFRRYRSFSAALTGASKSKN
jgi:hypothetical protein